MPSNVACVLLFVWLPVLLGMRLTSPGLSQAIPGPAGRHAVVEGRVLNSLTKEPLRKAEVALLPAGSGRAAYSSVSGPEGKFRFENIVAGRYRLRADLQGFLRQEFGAKRAAVSGLVLSFSAGEEWSDLTIPMIPQSVLAGRVVDEEGAPVQHVRVRAMRSGFLLGKRTLMPAGNPFIGATTDDRGEFRISDLSPGRHILVADYYRSRVTPEQPVVPPAARPERFVTTYYPGSTDYAGAAALDLQPGQSLEGLSIQLRKMPVFRVRGRVVPAASGGLDPGLRVAAQPRDSTSGGDLVFGIGVLAQKDGRFDLTGVPGGSYYLAVVSMIGSPRVLTRLPIEIGSEDIDDLTIPLPGLMQLSGEVRVEGNAKPERGGVQVTLSLADAPGVNPPAAISRADGTFVLEKVGPGVHTVSILGGPSGAYVKSVVVGEREALGRRIDLTHGASGRLQIILSLDGGQVEGTVQWERLPAPPPKGGIALSATVVLVPDPVKPEDSDSYRVTTTDQRGNFVFKGIRPGEYRLYAWEDVEPGAWFETEFLKASEDSSVKVKVTEGAKLSLQVPLISAEAKGPGNNP